MNIKNMINTLNQKFVALAVAVVLVVVALPADEASANSNYYYTPTPYQYQPINYGSWYGQSGTQMNQAELIAFLKQLIAQLQAQIANQGGYSYGVGYYGSGNNYVVGKPYKGSSRNDDDEPEVETESARNIDETSARLRGSVDMNDFEDGEVFFVYGTDEDQIEDVPDDYDSYRDVDTDGERLRKVRVDSNLDDDEDYDHRVTGLRRDTRYYFSICVGYEDEDDDDVLACGDVLRFTTND